MGEKNIVLCVINSLEVIVFLYFFLQNVFCVN